MALNIFLYVVMFALIAALPVVVWLDGYDPFDERGKGEIE